MTDNPDPGVDETVPPWLRFKWPVHGHLERRLGIEGVRRLGELLSESGALTLPEAEPWLDLNQVRWHAIMRILATGFYHRIKAGFPPPPHVMRWMERFVETDSPDTPTFWSTPGWPSRVDVGRPEGTVNRQSAAPRPHMTGGFPRPCNEAVAAGASSLNLPNDVSHGTNEGNRSCGRQF